MPNEAYRRTSKSASAPNAKEETLLTDKSMRHALPRGDLVEDGARRYTGKLLDLTAPFLTVSDVEQLVAVIFIESAIIVVQDFRDPLRLELINLLVVDA